MKATGMVRPLDKLGRIVLPKSIRQSLNIDDGDSLEIFIENNNVVLQKYSPSCVFCNESSEIVLFKDKKVCNSCLQELLSK